MKVNIGRYPEGEDQRVVDITIEEFDTWNMDSTLALIIVPMLKQLKETKHGGPQVVDEDVPEAIRSTSAPAKKDDWDIDNFHFDRWNYVIDEMIWAMGQVANCTDDCFYDHTKVNEEDSIEDQIANISVDYEGLKAHHLRIKNGCMLFGKYFQALWD